MTEEEFRKKTIIFDPSRYESALKFAQSELDALEGAEDPLRYQEFLRTAREALEIILEQRK